MEVWKGRMFLQSPIWSHITDFTALSTYISVFAADNLLVVLSDDKNRWNLFIKTNEAFIEIITYFEISQQ